MIATERLLLRPWRERDRAPYHAMKSDPRMMATLGPLQSRAESDTAIDRLIALEESLGYTFWAVARREDGVLLGYCGFLLGTDDFPIAGELEIGWGLGSGHWGRGYAREAAEAALKWGWANTDYRRIVAITTPGNTRSWSLMERLGMERVPDGDFDHPRLAEGDPLRRHLTYAIARP